MKRRICSALLVFAMLLALLPMSAFAAQPTGLLAGKAYETRYYDQLDATAKTAYNAIYASPLRDGPVKASDVYTDGVVIDLANVPVAERTFSGVTFYVTASATLNGNTRSINITNTSFDEATAAAMSAYITNTLTAADYALRLDHPELSWLVNTEFSCQYSYDYNVDYNALDYSAIPNGQSGTVTVTNKTITITRLYFGLSPEGYRDATTDLAAGQVTADNCKQANTGNRAILYARIHAAKQAIDRELTAGSTPYDKVRAIHNWVCANVAYADQASSAFQNSWRGYQTAYSALVDGVTVCGGYANAFKLLCDEYGIPCVVVIGTGAGNGVSGDHGWNYVKLDGKWYAVDCTWDDKPSGMITNWFLVGSDTFFRDSLGYTHTEKPFYPGYDFVYPVLSKTAYDPAASGTAGNEPVSNWKSPFQDVKESDWYYEAVRFVNENGLMSGYTDTQFGPSNNLSRAQLAQILYSNASRPAVNVSNVFTDVPSNAWFANAVNWATEKGIVSGYGNGHFGPGDNVTHEQLAVILWGYAGHPASSNRTLPFTDAGKVSSYALNALYWAVETGVIDRTGGQLMPQGYATRSEVAQMLKNYLDR